MIGGVLRFLNELAPGKPYDRFEFHVNTGLLERTIVRLQPETIGRAVALEYEKQRNGITAIVEASEEDSEEEEEESNE